MKRNLLIASIGAVLLSGSGIVAYAFTTFNDVPSGHWAESAISWNADAGIMQGPGYKPGSFDPAGNVNRAQLAIVNQRMYNLVAALVQEKLDKITGTTTTTTTPASSDAVTALRNDTEILDLRNQLMGKSFVAKMNGSQMVQPVSTLATGTGSFMLTDKGLVYDITVQNISGLAREFTFGVGKIGENATGSGVPFGFSGDHTAGAYLGTGGAYAIGGFTASDIRNLLQGKYYITIKSSAFPAGEIRGQLIPVQATNFKFDLSGQQEVPSVAIASKGTTWMSLTNYGLMYYVTTEGMTQDITAAHIHRGEPRKSGLVEKTLNCNTTVRFCAGLITDMSDDQKKALLNGDMYVNVHTAANSNGEIRGQAFLTDM